MESAAKNPLLGEDPVAPPRLADRARATLMSLLSEGVYLVNANGVIVEVNDAIQTISGYSRDEIVGQSPSIFHSGVHDQTFYAMLWLTLIKSGKWGGIVWNRRKNGEVYKQQLRIQALYAQDSTEAIGYQAVALDLSALCQNRPGDQGAPIAHERSSFLASLRALLMSQPEAAAAVCIVDVDRFTEINARYGHKNGDRLLGQIVVRLRDCLRDHDAVTRLSGDEFAFYLSRMADLAETGATIRRVHEALHKPYDLDGEPVELTMCIGTAMYPFDRGGGTALMRAAAHALVAAKACGRGQARQYLSPALSDDTPGARVGVHVEEGMRNGQMRLFYQPKVDMVTGDLLGFEALLRWQHPERGLIAPDEFLKRVRSQRILIEIGEWVIDRVLGQIDTWRRRHGIQMRVSINLVAEQLASAGFARKLGAIAEKYPDVPLSCLEIEIIDAATLRDFNDARAEMCACRDLGVTFAIDDLGAAGSGEDSVLEGLPIHTLKIDSFFVKGLQKNTSDREIVQKAIEVGLRLNRRVIAEGVETEEIGTDLLKMGCRHAQGYFIAQPMPPEDAVAWAVGYRAPQAWRDAEAVTMA